uniref:Uncharacterized protein n=1 Tax=Sipha flava TaxID=143950 RepID=A0A2S2QZI1_9HEMI
MYRRKYLHRIEQVFRVQKCIQGIYKIINSDREVTFNIFVIQHIQPNPAPVQFYRDHNLPEDVQKRKKKRRPSKNRSKIPREIGSNDREGRKGRVRRKSNFRSKRFHCASIHIGVPV